MADTSPQGKTDTQVQEEFTSYYLQKVTQEFAEDLDKIRNADDFKNDALPLLISALQQGTALFSPEEQRRIATAQGPSPTAPPQVTDATEAAGNGMKQDGSEKKKRKRKTRNEMG